MVINGPTVYAYYWQSRGLSDGELNARGTTTSNDESRVLKCENNKLGLQFTGDILRQNKVTFNHGKVVNIYTVYKLSFHPTNIDFTLENCLFGAVKVTKHSDVDKYNYSGYGTCFDSRRTFSHSDGTTARNLIIFGCDLASSVHANNKTNDISILSKSLV